MDEPCRFRLSFPFVDLRFFIMRANANAAREYWLRPRWWIKDSGRNKVGKIGLGFPLPVPNEKSPYSRRAIVDGFLLLQTPSEAEERQLNLKPHNGFIFRGRELVTDDWGHVRFDMTIEAVGDGEQIADMLHTLLDSPMLSPLDEQGDGEFPLIEAAERIARVYETESTKTASGYADRTDQGNYQVFEAASGTIVSTGPPLIVQLDTCADAGPSSDWGMRWDDAFSARLTRPSALMSNSASYWRFTTKDRAANEAAEYAAIKAVSGFAWLFGNFYEVAVLGLRVKEYRERAGAGTVFYDLVRDGINKRNNRFGAEQFGGWRPRELLTGVVQVALNSVDKHARDQLIEIGASVEPFARDVRDGGGITGNIVREINVQIIATNSIVAVNSTLTDVRQTIGTMQNLGAADRKEMERQIELLSVELQRLIKQHPERSEEAEAVTEKVREAVDRAKGDKPNKTLLRSALDTAKAVAESIKDVAPPVIGAVTTIGGIILKMHGF